MTFRLENKNIPPINKNAIVDGRDRTPGCCSRSFSLSENQFSGGKTECINVSIERAYVNGSIHNNR